ncbi:hypothetical protein [Lihuaxuella thermophila]|uniref:Uncharacterized protein n=1 Tax=Lihuaxuella thermophila TaxID=1173111 RepID=A0A1H8AM01_9BACL|nr:hypothetical protein [Lihuaxuella thermophila]SEM71014.1 hypothetical protein SAMN05444955_101199 [Lihuaxuella thermophila]
MKPWLRCLGVLLLAGALAFSLGAASVVEAKQMYANAVYWSGSGVLHPGESIESDPIFLKRGQKVLEITHISSGRVSNDPWQGSYTIELFNRKGQVVDSCIGDSYDFEVTAECYFESLRPGKYTVKITNLDTSEMNVIHAALRD